MTTNLQSNRPTHRVYAVTKRGDKSHWQAIGAAWEHGDGEGFAVKLEYLPLNGADIVIRRPKEKAEAGEGGAQ
jgi:hypothetical protein